MNEIESAVAEIVGSNYGECQCHRETMMLAAEALREKAERERGCEWCRTPSFNPDIGGCQLAFYKSKAHPDGAYAVSVSVLGEWGEEQEPVLVQIDNCIRCGKRLEVEHDNTQAET